MPRDIKARRRRVVTRVLTHAAWIIPVLWVVLGLLAIPWFARVYSLWWDLAWRGSSP